jgi:hypothetical protein
MNLHKWKKQRGITPLALKLCEEVGEVNKEIGSWVAEGKELNYKAALEEIDHVIFIAEQLRKRVKERRDNRNAS